MTAVAPTVAYLPPLPFVRPPRAVYRPARATTPDRRAGRPRRAVYWRRRLAVMLLALAALPVLADRAAGVFGGSPSAPVHELRTTRYVVMPGDTLWTIAHHLEPKRDPREVVDALVTARHTTVVQPGEVIEWAGL